MRILSLIILTITLIGCSESEQQSQQKKLKAFNETLGEQKAAAMDEAVASFAAFLKVNFPNEGSYEDRALTFLKELDSACTKGTTLTNDLSWTMDTVRNTRIVELFENSGLRKEIWLYGNEEYSPHHDLSELLDSNSFSSSSPEKYSPATFQSDSELMSEAEEFSKMEGYEYETMLKGLKAKRELRKNSLYTNIYGDFIYGLIKHSEDSSLTKSFAVWQVKMAVSPCALVRSLIESNKTKVDLSDPFIKRIVVTELYFPIIYQDVQKNK